MASLDICRHSPVMILLPPVVSHYSADLCLGWSSSILMLQLHDEGFIIMSEQCASDRVLVLQDRLAYWPLCRGYFFRKLDGLFFGHVYLDWFFQVTLFCMFSSLNLWFKKVSVYDQEIPQSHTADQPTAS